MSVDSESGESSDDDQDNYETVVQREWNVNEEIIQDVLALVRDLDGSVNVRHDTGDQEHGDKSQDTIDVLGLVMMVVVSRDYQGGIDRGQGT